MPDPRREPQQRKREHIGDGVYVRLDGGLQIELRTSDGHTFGPAIYIEPGTWARLCEWIRHNGLQSHFPVK